MSKNFIEEGRILVERMYEALEDYKKNPTIDNQIKFYIATGNLQENTEELKKETEKIKKDTKILMVISAIFFIITIMIIAAV